MFHHFNFLFIIDTISSTGFKMKFFLTLSILFSTASLSFNNHAFPELPFCPAGGPPGWMNHFNYKRDQNSWRRHSRQAPPAYKRPAYYGPNYNRPYNYFTPPDNHTQQGSAVLKDI
jgi:hypothetical protein